MPSEFELAMQGAVRAITTSVLARAVLYRQGISETAITAAWREGDGLGQSQIQAEATILISDLPDAPKNGDEIDSDGTTYSVRSVSFDGVGGARLGLRTLKVAI